MNPVSLLYWVIPIYLAIGICFFMPTWSREIVSRKEMVLRIMFWPYYILSGYFYYRKFKKAI